MLKRLVTIKDIAEELGIAPSTVSKALKNHPAISKETRASVNELAKRLNYKPNAIALSLRNSRSQTLGLVVPQIVHFFFSSVISGIEDLAYDAGYNVMIFQSNESYNREVIGIQALLSSQVEGILISLSKETRNCEHLQNALDMGIPLVMFDRVSKDIDTDKVLVDDYHGAYHAVTHLIHIGCRRIAHLSGPPGLDIADNRKSGYIQALLDNHMELDRDLIMCCDNFKQARIRTKQLMNIPNPPDAFFCVNDLTAVGVVKSLHELGIAIPERVSVIGFSNEDISQVSHPALSTVDQHGYQMGQTAIQLLLDRLMATGSNLPFVHHEIKTELVLRDSTRITGIRGFV
ncbi:MAG: LacI family DNA-binding transcriptional regulator [Bacteroidales bacterium]|nr:LacI family DNA-binding transcriptional regulator [Bacteroidales bacterium]